MPSILFLLFTYCSEALIVFTYARSIYKPKRSNSLSFCFVIALYMILMIIYKFFPSYEIINALLIVLVNIMIVFLAFKSSFKSALFHCIVLCILQYIAEVASVYGVALILNVSSLDVVDNYFETATFISRVLYFLFSNLLARFSTKENHSKAWGRWALLSVLPLSSIFIVLVIRELTVEIVLSSYQNVICIVSLILLLAVNIIVYMIYERAEESSQKLFELEIAGRKNEIDLKYLSLLEKKNETMQIMAHDYKNHMMTIQSMANSEQINEYINGMLGEISQYNRVCKTKNRLLDVILGKYSDICDDKGITFEMDILSDNLSILDANDTSSLFNNILDNAVEAAEKSQEKYISLTISKSLGAYHKVIVVNSSDSLPKVKSGVLQTSKSNKSGHGFGTKSMSRIVGKYGGELDWKYDEDSRRFTISVIIPENAN